jgi:hypothetical protein
MSTTKPTRYAKDVEGSPQILVKLRKMNGEEDRTIVVHGNDGKSFRIVLDDVYHEIREGETLEQAVRRQQAAWTRKVWADMPECWIDDSEPKPTLKQQLKALIEEFDDYNLIYDTVASGEQDDISERQDEIFREVFHLARGIVEAEETTIEPK